jgi:predicted transcriptional regulator
VGVTAKKVSGKILGGYRASKLSLTPLFRFTSMRSLAQVLSENNRALLRVIREH